MHLIKNDVEHIVRLISGFHDSLKVRNEEKARGRFSEAHASGKTRKLLPAPFRLTVTEAKLADERLMGIQVPIRFGWKPRTPNTKKVQGMKSHYWKQLVSTNTLKYCIRDLLGQQHYSFSAVFFLGCLLIAVSLVVTRKQCVQLGSVYLIKDAVCER